MESEHLILSQSILPDKLSYVCVCVVLGRMCACACVYMCDRGCDGLGGESAYTMWNCPQMTSWLRVTGLGWRPAPETGIL